MKTKLILNYILIGFIVSLFNNNLDHCYTTSYKIKSVLLWELQLYKNLKDYGYIDKLDKLYYDTFENTKDKIDMNEVYKDIRKNTIKDM